MVILKDLSFEERMKHYEFLETSRRFCPLLPIIVRIDGKNFHNWTRDLDRPYDEQLSNLFEETLEFLLDETNADLGYTQSDEISLLFKNDSINSEIFFAGKIFKLISITASLATAFFNTYKSWYGSLDEKGFAIFDSRAFNLPNVSEVTNYFLWRIQDATRNSIQMAAQKYFSPKQLHGKSCQELKNLLIAQYSIDWNDYPNYFKYGKLISRKNNKITFESNFEFLHKIISTV